MSGAFTPGPWRLGLDPQNVVAGNSRKIATTFAIGFGADCFERAEANAALIAAAPDLLAMLKELRDDYPDTSFRDRIDALIAKATASPPQSVTALGRGEG